MTAVLGAAGCEPPNGNLGEYTGTGSSATDDTSGSATDGTSGSSSATDGTSDAAPADSTPSAIAFLRAEKPAPPFGDPPPGNPDDILIDITNFTRTCGEPYGFPECGPEAYRELTFVLNPDEQQPGSYAPADLDAELWSQSSVDSPCESNGPFAVEGAIEIVALTAEEITVRVEGSEYTDGEYTVVLCAG
ncbi:hypothetical protein [Nannocystis exedens]|uniref:hypothetical protein n=1 Tax=Nannocystis exedens TaxID=54 RepID=UPI000BBA08DF|nr:hypothetical protein [Nannocystis exedens]